MALINRIFSGRLDYDTHPYRLAPGDFSEALNITRDSEGMGSDEVVSNIVGNRLVDYTLPSGTKRCIGNEPDKVRNRVYYFVWNSTGKHSILYYDKSVLPDGVIVKVFENLTDSGNVDILHWNPSWRINHIDIVYSEELGDVVFWTNGLNPPSQFNVLLATTGAYGVWEESYISVIKAPPQVPPAVVYEDDVTVTVNNLRKKLFRIKYEFEYDNFERSVTSSQSVMPLPVNYQDSAIDKDPTKNARIAIVVQTGTSRVKKIRISAALSLGNTMSDFFLVQVLDKALLSIPDNDIYTYRFYNDQVYTYLNIQQSILGFDWVPQTAYTQCLPNGNVLCYGAITEGYDLVSVTGSTSVSAISQRTTQLPFIYVGSQSGNSGFGTGNIHIKVIGSVVVGDTFNIYTTSKTVTFVSAGTTTAAVIAGLAAAAIVQGFTVVSSDTENLVIIQTNEVLQRIYVAATIRAVTDSFGWDYDSGIQPSRVYFDEYGRTNGVMTKMDFPVRTIPYGKTLGVQDIPKINVEITNRPPLWARYYHIVFTKNTTESSFLYWVSSETLKDQKYVYIGIQSINAFKDENQDSPISYGFTAGDRIRFLQVLSGNVNTIYTNQDFEILSTEENPNVNGVQQSGQFVKIALPTTSSTFDFGTAPFYNYFIKLYTPAQSVANGLDVSYEMSERYAIGNAGTVNAYHQGMLQNQTANLSQPATFEFTQGDVYYRIRKIDTGNTATWDITSQTSLGGGEFYPALSLKKSTINAVDFLVQSTSPLFTIFINSSMLNNWAIFKNNISASTQFKLEGIVNFTSTINATSMSLVIETWNGITGGGTVQIPITIATIPNVIANVNYVINVNTVFTFPATTNRAFFGLKNANLISGFRGTVSGNLKINETNKTYDVGVFDRNFSDFFSSAVNSYGRPWVEDPNAAQTYYPTLRRNGGEYQQDTTNNQINRFYFDVQDTYNRNFGDIRKLFVNGSKMYVFQKFDIGVVPILIQVVRDVQGNPLEANSDILLNKIFYPYAGKIGIGNVPESFAHGKFAMYGVDNNKGVVWRLSNDGLIILSVLYKTNSFFIPNLANFRTDLNNGIAAAGQTYTGNPTVLGVYDAYTNKYIVALQEINRYSDPNTLTFHQDPYTLSFLETRNTTEGFESKYSYFPENMGCLDNLMMVWRDGQLWKHDNPVFCNFFGQQFGCDITLVFNDFMTLKKTFQSIMETSNVTWYCQSITTSLGQYSTLLLNEFVLLEGEESVAFKRDINSTKGKINGDLLKGQYIIIKLRVDNAADFVFLNSATVYFNESPLNKK